MTLLQMINKPELIDKPLFIEDFVNGEVNYNSVKTLLSRYVKAGDLKRYAQGIYYVPKKTILGESTLSFESVFERKYIADNEKIFGYYSGMSLLNLVGLSSQVPNIPEITTNNEATRKRKVKIGKRSLIVRKSSIEINSDNVLYLQFLDIFRYADVETIKEKKDRIIVFFDRQDLSFEKLSEIERKVSMRIRKALRDSDIFDKHTTPLIKLK
ncbi:MAG: hypothetical protein IJI46_01310 [Erysipelotrichaceae bacterium]|nr:hypothetical protein [Erysipelotrichaceae bacterium]